ncbi:acyl-CoA dehydrogenase [Fodinicola acaciae]|uniref:acyl-CoA dehydrogenase family protein n=1 Tax=Fodinicola acaciae TaxID=2681555 RepID=UPI0013D0095F|nr:acyl-CoA dehydrogenase [Fodinicola acaciae]
MSITASLRQLLDGRWSAAKAAARDGLEKAGFEPTDQLGTEEHRARIHEQMRLLADSGHARLGFSSAVGGADDLGGSVASFEMLAYGDLSLMVKAGVQWGLFGGAIQALGTERHHMAYLPAVMSFQLPGCFAMTETGHGSDVQHLRTTATYDVSAEEFVIHSPDPAARKDYIGNAARDGRMAVVFAQLEDHGVHAFLVPIRDESGAPMPGVWIGDCGRKAGLNGVDNGRLLFDRVRVPRSALLNRYGDVAPDGTYTSPIESASRRFFTMLGTLIRGRISVAGAAGSATKVALAIAIGYGERRRQFAAPGGEENLILDYLVHQRKLLPALARTYALHFAQEQLVATMHDGPADEQGQRELEARAAGIKAVATQHATETIQMCRQACGGAGYLSANRLPQLKADTDVFTTFEGDNTVLLQLVAKGLLTSYRDHFGELDVLGTVRFVADQVVESVIEATAARTLLQADLGDRAYHLKLFEDREKHLLDGAARRLRRAGKDNAFEVFNASQDHLLAAARAHIDRHVLEAFVAGIAACPDEEAVALLEKVCDLYVLSTVESDRGWFLEHGRLSPSRAKEVTQRVNALCGELRPHVDVLIDAFGIPDACLSTEM